HSLYRIRSDHPREQRQEMQQRPPQQSPAASCSLEHSSLRQGLLIRNSNPGSGESASLNCWGGVRDGSVTLKFLLCECFMNVRKRYSDNRDLASCHSASSAASSSPASDSPRAPASCSISTKRRRNFSDARRSAISGSRFRCRDRFTRVNSTSPSSSSTCAISPAASASRSSASSASTCGSTAAAAGQSNPTLAAFFCSFVACCNAGSPDGTPSSALAWSRPLRARSSALICSQACLMPSMLLSISCSPNTCG